MTDSTTPFFEYKDMFGREIKVGDYIVYAALADRSGVLRAGRVLELTKSKTSHGTPVPKVKCESWNYYQSQNSWRENVTGKQKAVSLSFLSRMVVVPESYVSQKIKDDLDGK